MKSVACVGILVADVMAEPANRYPKPGELIQVNSITMHNGGNAMTASVNLTNLGVKAKVFGNVGDDVFGNFLKDKLKEYHVDATGLHTDKNTQTSTSLVMINGETGERSFTHCVGANGTFSINHINFDDINDCDLVFVTGSFLLNTFDGEQTAEFLKQCKQAGKTTFLDVCWDAKGEWDKKLNMAMPYIDYFMPSIDEAREIAHKDDLDEMASVFMKNGVKNVIIKAGGDGAYIREAGEAKGTMYPIIKGVKAVDTTGAGDSFCSGFLSAFARGLAPKECVKIGNATGAMCVSAIGATTGITNFEEAQKIASLGEYKC